MSDTITVPELNTITTIQADDAIMLTHQNGVTEKIAASNLTARDTFIIASGTTLTGPTLGTGFPIRILFTEGITGLNASSPLTINYNGQDYTVKVAKNGNLINFIAKAFTENNDTVYKYLQAYTVLELVYNGTNLVIVGNPIVLSGNDYKYYADGSEELSVVDEVAIDNMHSVTSNAVAAVENEIIDLINNYKASGQAKTGTNSVGWSNIINIGILEEGKYAIITFQTGFDIIAIQTASTNYATYSYQSYITIIEIPAGGSGSNINIAGYSGTSRAYTLNSLLLKIR